MDELLIDEHLSIPMSEIEMSAVRSRGPGGQNVNKVATAVQLRFDIESSRALPEDVRERMLARDDRRISKGVIVIKSQQYRSQARNRAAALERLADTVRSALHEAPKRIPTHPGEPCHPGGAASPPCRAASEYVSVLRAEHS